MKYHQQEFEHNDITTARLALEQYQLWCCRSNTNRAISDLSRCYCLSKTVTKMFYYISVGGVSACTSPTHLCTLHHPFHLFHYYSENLSALHSLVHSWDFMTEKENNWLYITIISSCCDQLPFLPDTTCVCQRHRRETTVPRGRLCPPPQLAWTNPPGKSNTHRELTHTHTHTHQLHPLGHYRHEPYGAVF